jgi:hypothetical protein
MKKYLLVICVFLVCRAHSQIKMLCLENVDPADELKSTSYYQTYVGAFDFIISLRSFDNWGPGITTAVAYNKIGWHKIEINTSRFFRDSSKSEVLISIISRKRGDSLFQIFNENHLFEMQDERMKKTPCDSFVLFDGPQYEFEIITKNQYKKVYFYAPEVYNKYCPNVIERNWVINCLKAFETEFAN